MRFRRFHPKAKILAIEADMGNFAVLQKNFAWDTRTIPLRRALWNREGELMVWPTWANVASRVGESPNHVAAVPVPGCTVPGLMREFELSGIDILKLDIEGAESVVFQTPDTRWLAQVRCIVFECCDADDAGTTMKVFDVLRQAGWRGNCHVCGENLVLIRSDLSWHMSPDVWMDDEPRVAAHIVEAMTSVGLFSNPTAD
jgi:FkbM family methyltransferase